MYAMQTSSAGATPREGGLPPLQIRNAHASVVHLTHAARAALAHLDELLDSDGRLDSALLRNALHLKSRLTATLEDAERTGQRLQQMCASGPARAVAARQARRARPVGA